MLLHLSTNIEKSIIFHQNAFALVDKHQKVDNFLSKCFCNCRQTSKSWQFLSKCFRTCRPTSKSRQFSIKMLSHMSTNIEKLIIFYRFDKNNELQFVLSKCTHLFLEYITLEFDSLSCFLKNFFDNFKLLFLFFDISFSANRQKTRIIFLKFRKRF